MLGGSPCIEERFCGLSLSLSTTTFFQVNTPQAERIVSLIRDWLSHELIRDALLMLTAASAPSACHSLQPGLTSWVWNRIRIPSIRPAKTR